MRTLGVDGDHVVELEADQRLDQVEEVGQEQPRAGLAAWEDGDDVIARWAAVLGDRCSGARALARRGRDGSRRVLRRLEELGSRRDRCPPLDAVEPALVPISGELRARYVPAFTKDAAGAVTHALGQPGYLGGLAINS